MLWRQEFLEELETLLGPRDKEFSLGDIVQVPLGWPDVPQIFRNDSTGTVEVFLTRNAMSGAYNGRLVKWQLAHECVHLIDPYFSPPTNVMEEGIATWFQNRKVEDEWFKLLISDAYREAECLVTRFMSDEYLAENLRLLRQNGIPICNVTSQQLMQVAERIDLPAAEALTARFGG